MSDTTQFAPQPAPHAPAPQPPASNKSFVATWLLSYFLGVFGVDRFYLGKVGTGIVKLITIGGFGIWWLIDLILVLAGAQRDKNGQPLAGYAEHKKLAWIVTAALIVASIVLSSVTSAMNGGTDVDAASVAAENTDSDTDADAAAEPPTDDAEPEEADEPAEPAEPTTPEWADSTFGSFEPINASGSGDDVVALPDGASAGIVAASYTGSGNFVVNVIDANNEMTGDLLVNTIGAYSGTTVYGFASLGDGVNLQITASGPWELTISPVSTASALPDSGTGDGVYLYDGDAASATISHNGSSNFVVQEESGKALSIGLLVNEIGTYSGTVPVSAGPSVITITADGDWTIAIG